MAMEYPLTGPELFNESTCTISTVLHIPCCCYELVTVIMETATVANGHVLSQ